MRLAGRTKSGRLDHDCEEAAFRQAFAAFDKDSSGTIDAHELKGLLKVMGIYADPLETEELLKQMDTDGNGVIDFEEFMAVMGGRQNVRRHQCVLHKRVDEHICILGLYSLYSHLN